MIVKEFFFFDMDELSRPFDRAGKSKSKTKRAKTGGSRFARSSEEPQQDEKVLIRFEPTLKSERKALGPSLGGRRTPASEMIDGDSDGKCQEEGGKWIPCPPGVRTGSALRRVSGKLVFDLPKGGGIDRIDEIPLTFRQKMNERLKKLSLTRRHLMDQARKAYGEASPELIAEARQWYSRVHANTRTMNDAINKKFGTSTGFEQAAAVIAALSPAREFGKNIRDARKLMVVMAEDAPFELTDELKEKLKGSSERLDRLVERAGNKPRPSDFTDEELDLLVGLHPVLAKLGNSTGLVNVIKAATILRGANIDDTLSGPKVRSFYSNIVDPDGPDRVTMDTWMYRAMVSARKLFTIGGETGTLKEHEAAGRRVQDLFQGTPAALKGTGIPGNVGLYPLFAEVIRDLAADLDMPPSALQAILWEVQRVRDGYQPTMWEKIAKEFLV